MICHLDNYFDNAILKDLSINCVNEEIRASFSILRSFLKNQNKTPNKGADYKIGILHDLVSRGTSAGEVAPIARVSWEERCHELFSFQGATFYLDFTGEDVLHICMFALG